MSDIIINEKVWISDNVLIMKPIKSIYYHYSYFWLRTIDFKNLNRGSTQPLVTKTDLSNQIVIIPDSNPLSRFNAISRALFKNILNNEQESATLAAIRDALLPKLMNGEVGVALEEIV